MLRTVIVLCQTCQFQIVVITNSHIICTYYLSRNSFLMISNDISYYASFLSYNNWIMPRIVMGDVVCATEPTNNISYRSSALTFNSQTVLLVQL